MYNSYFGFAESPFNVTPDPRLFYTNPVYQEAFAGLRYGIEAKKGFIVITGEVGTGKTTLLRKLMRTLGETIHSVFIFNTLLSFPELLQLILHDLGIAPSETNKVTMLQELNDYLIKQLKRGHIVSVLIDEAQNLSDEALEGLRLLSNLETDQEKLLQIVLMGQPELKAKLDQPGLRQLKQRVAFQCQLAPLKEEETGPYIDFRLRAVGYGGKELFQSEAIQQVAFYSQGIPRLINVICDNALLNAYAESKKTVSAQMIQEVGRDLRLRAQDQSGEEKAGSTQENAPAVGSKLLPRQNWHRSAKTGVAAAAASLAFIALASVTDPHNLVDTASNRLELSKHNLNQWVALVIHPKIEREEVVPKSEREIDTQWKLQRISIPHGSTISKIVTDAYGNHSYLALDIIKEFNPQISNLNSVFPGQELVLPPLTHETMVRRQADGSYRLIVASFSSKTEADNYARLLSNSGYQAVITPKKVSDDLLLHRVEVDGLKNFEEANRVWDAGLRTNAAIH